MAVWAEHSGGLAVQVEVTIGPVSVTSASERIPSEMYPGVQLKTPFLQAGGLFADRMVSRLTKPICTLSYSRAKAEGTRRDGKTHPEDVAVTPSRKGALETRSHRMS